MLPKPTAPNGAHPASQGPVGRITGTSVGELRFRIGPDEPVHLGEILIADSSRTSRGIKESREPGSEGPGDSAAMMPPFYLRVVDLEYGADARDGDWEERTAGALMSTGGEDLVLYDREERLFKSAVAEPLGYLQADGRFRKPKTLPPHFCPIRRPVAGDFRFLAPKKGDLELGFLRSGDEPLPDRLGLDPKALAQHIGIFATTGMGKSNLLKVLAGSTLDSGQVGFLLLDPHGEYADGGAAVHPDGRPLKGLLHHPRSDRLHVYTSRAIPGFPGRVHELAVSAAEITPADFANVYNVSDAQEEALWAVGNLFRRDWISRVDALEPEQLDAALGKGRFHPGTLNVLKRRCEQVLKQPVIHTDAAVSTTKGILSHLEAGHTVLVDTSGLFPSEELLVSAVLARSLLERYRDAARDPVWFRSLPPVCVTLEEAQRVLNQRGGSNNVFAQIAREGRKFKVGLGAVTQQPRLLSDELLSQLNTLVILGLADPTDRERVRGGARQDLSQVAKEIQMLEPGEALVTTPGAPFALPLKAHLYEDRIEEQRARAAAQPPTVRIAPKADAGFY
ncbi:MAG TPA: ATP-binding protein [Candidatus Thermoplasmatota archaeon]|nr:ATP-binding protein [Candidatus Thermoplasmatota archaeon]